MVDALARDTVRLSVRVDAQVQTVWTAYSDSAARAQWGVPAGEAMVYDESDFREGGRDRYRCGPPESLDVEAQVEYTRIVPHELVVYTETVRTAGQPLATGVVSWEFAADGDGTVVSVVSQVVSFVGEPMIDGTRNGHAKALDQLGEYASEL